jgi:hypothetical protein
MKSNFTLNIIQKAIRDGFTTLTIDCELNYDQLWLKVKREIIQEHRKQKIEELFPDIKNNNKL